MLEVLICTQQHRLSKALQVPLEEMQDVRYLISCQFEGEKPQAPQITRDDISLVFLEGCGLSRNRNNALHHAKGDILLLSDDDEQLDADALPTIKQAFEQNPQFDIIQFQAQGLGKTYPSHYISSVELAMRAEVAQHISFDERFGLGSPCLSSGEEDVFVSDAQRQGFRLGFVPLNICTIQGPTTGHRFLGDKRVQRSKGAVFALTHGTLWAYYKCTREALGWFLRRGANPFRLMKNMFWGIKFVKKQK